MACSGRCGKRGALITGAIKQIRQGKRIEAQRKAATVARSMARDASRGVSRLAAGRFR